MVTRLESNPCKPSLIQTTTTTTVATSTRYVASCLCEKRDIYAVMKGVTSSYHQCVENVRNKPQEVEKPLTDLAICFPLSTDSNSPLKARNMDRSDKKGQSMELQKMRDGVDFLAKRIRALKQRASSKFLEKEFKELSESRSAIRRRSRQSQGVLSMFCPVWDVSFARMNQEYQTLCMMSERALSEADLKKYEESVERYLHFVEETRKNTETLLRCHEKLGALWSLNLSLQHNELRVAKINGSDVGDKSPPTKEGFFRA